MCFSYSTLAQLGLSLLMLHSIFKQFECIPYSYSSVVAFEKFPMVSRIKSLLIVPSVEAKK